MASFKIRKLHEYNRVASSTLAYKQQEGAKFHKIRTSTLPSGCTACGCDEFLKSNPLFAISALAHHHSQSLLNLDLFMKVELCTWAPVRPASRMAEVHVPPPWLASRACVQTSATSSHARRAESTLLPQPPPSPASGIDLSPFFITCERERREDV